MTRMLYAATLLAALVVGSGCAMCDDCHDFDPPAFGGVCADGVCGARAGSIITPSDGMIIEGNVVTEDAQPEGSVLPPLEPVPVPDVEYLNPSG